MKKMIRSRVTHAFLTRDGNWTSDLSKAARIDDVYAATEVVIKLGLSDVELYYSFRDERLSQHWDFSHPLTGI